MRDPPSGRVSEQGPNWLLVATEACGGGTPGLGFFLEVSVFIGIFGVGLMLGGLQAVHEAGGHTQGGGRTLHPCGRLVAPLTSSPSLLVVFWSKTNHREGSILFGIPFLRNSKTGKK